jgi:hypothetical protein
MHKDNYPHGFSTVGEAVRAIPQEVKMGDGRIFRFTLTPGSTVVVEVSKPETNENETYTILFPDSAG